jgi:hypothetical protein
MGTNYYLHDPKATCEHCGRGDEPRHIGKSSAGWCFALHVYDDIDNLEDWQKYWTESGVTIRDECDEVIEPREMTLIIVDRRWERPIPPSFEYGSDCVPGPNNLMRAKVDRGHCVGHGPGTWDLMQGEFS